RHPRTPPHRAARAAAAGTRGPDATTLPLAPRRRSSRGSGNSCSARGSPAETRRRPAARESRSRSAPSGRRRATPVSSGLRFESLSEELAFVVLALLADVETGDRAVVAHHAGPDFAALALVVGQSQLDGSDFLSGTGIHDAVSSATRLATGDWAAMA